MPPEASRMRTLGENMEDGFSTARTGDTHRIVMASASEVSVEADASGEAIVQYLK